VPEQLATDVRSVEREVAEAAKDRLARVARRPVAEHVLAHDGVEAIGTDQKIARNCGR
jgi:hypothetical protein